MMCYTQVALVMMVPAEASVAAILTLLVPVLVPAVVAEIAVLPVFDMVLMITTLFDGLLVVVAGWN